MTITEGLLVMMVIVLTIALFGYYRNGSSSAGTTAQESLRMPKFLVRKEHMNGCKCPKCSRHNGPEKAAVKENIEYFSSSIVDTAPDSVGASEGQEYAKNPYGGAGMTYNDYVASMAVDPQVIQNHAEYVKDRMGTKGGGVITGPTMAMGEMESTTLNGYVGLRRPQSVAVCSPTTVTDPDLGGYTDKPTFTWNSTPSSSSENYGTASIQ